MASSKVRRRVLGNQLFGGLNGLSEAGRVRSGQERGFDHDHFLELHALAQHLRVVDHEAGEILVHSQMPTKEWPSVSARTGLRPACSRQDA